MSLEELEQLAHERGLKGRAHQELQRVLDLVADRERDYFMWHRVYLFSAGIALWVMMFAAVIFLISLDIDLALPSGLGIFLAAVLAVTFWIFLVSMFKRQEHERELASLEARAYAMIESS